MIYQFTTGERYFDKKDEKAIQDFLKDEPQTGMIYTAKNEKRLVLRVDLPTGVVTKETVFAPEGRKDGTRAYHTPRASIAGDRRAHVSYQNVDTKEHFRIPQEEWLEFVKEGFTADEQPERPESAAEIRARKAELARLTKQFKEEQEEQKVEKRKAARSARDN